MLVGCRNFGLARLLREPAGQNAWQLFQALRGEKERTLRGEVRRDSWRGDRIRERRLALHDRRYTNASFRDRCQNRRLRTQRKGNVIWRKSFNQPRPLSGFGPCSKTWSAAICSALPVVPTRN